MGKFTSSSYSNTIDSLVNATTSKINNPFYKFSDKKPTMVTYYKLNRERSTLDAGAKIVADNAGKNSPLRYNKIENFYIYGLDRIQISYDSGDFGLEASAIEGDAIILPGSIEPSQGDFFVIPYIKEGVCFHVTAISPDTLEDGANIYQISYVNQYYDVKDIERNVVESFKYIVDNSGTNFTTLLQSSDYELVETLEVLVENLIKYYYELFFDSRVQTFIYQLNDSTRIYDPYFIEFLKRNNVMSYGSSFIYVDHQCSLEKTFSLNYSKTFFNALENPSDKFDPQIYASAQLIMDSMSLFSTRIQDYYKLMYFGNSGALRLEIFDNEVIQAIKDNEYFSEKSDKSCFNIWIAYFNNANDYIKGHIVENIKKFDWQENKECFYGLAIDIFIIERYIEFLMNKRIKNI